MAYVMVSIVQSVESTLLTWMVNKRICCTPEQTMRLEALRDGRRLCGLGKKAHQGAKQETERPRWASDVSINM